MKRKIDDLGRLVIPSEIRKELGIKNGDSVDIQLVNNKIILTNPDNDNLLEEFEKWLMSDEAVITLKGISEELELLKRKANYDNN